MNERKTTTKCTAFMQSTKKTVLTSSGLLFTAGGVTGFEAAVTVFLVDGFLPGDAGLVLAGDGALRAGDAFLAGDLLVTRGASKSSSFSILGLPRVLRVSLIL